MNAGKGMRIFTFPCGTHDHWAVQVVHANQRATSSVTRGVFSRLSLMTRDIHISCRAFFLER